MSDGVDGGSLLNRTKLRLYKEQQQNPSPLAIATYAEFLNRFCPEEKGNISSFFKRSSSDISDLDMEEEPHSCSLALCWHATFLGDQLLAEDSESPSPSSSSPSHSSKSEMLSKDRQLRREERIQQVIHLFQRALEVSKPHPLVLGNFASFLHKVVGDTVRAQEVFKDATVKWPSQATVYVKWGNLMKHACRNLDRAEELYRRAIELNPAHADALGNLAILLHARGPRFHEEAEKFYLLAIKADDKHANNLGNYGLFLADSRKDTHGAQTYYFRALQVCPEHANSLYNLGVLFDCTIRPPEYDQAERYYRQAIKAKPRHGFALYNLAVLMQHVRKDYEAAESLFERSIMANPNDPLTLADFASLLVDFKLPRMTESGKEGVARRAVAEQAESLLKRAASLAPQDAKVAYTLGILRKDFHKDYDAAVAHFRRAVALEPSHARALGELATIYLDVKEDENQAKSFYEEALRVDPSNARNLVNFADYLSDFSSDFERAEPLYERALEQCCPHQSQDLFVYICYNYASFLSRHRQKDRPALDLLHRAAEVGPENADVAGEIAILTWRTTLDIKRTEEAFRRALDLDSSHRMNQQKYASFQRDSKAYGGTQ